MASHEDMEINRKYFQTYVGGPIHIKTMLHLIEEEVKAGSNIFT